MNLPLAGLTVLDLTRLLPGPYCTMILADLGAKVIRVEEPHFTYPTSVPCYQNGDIKQPIFDTIIMRNKHSIELNLKLPADNAQFIALAKEADIIIEGFRPGIVTKLGIDYDTINQLNPNIIYCSLTGYGQSGPYSALPGHDINFVGLSGNFFVKEGTPPKSAPQMPLHQISDISGGLWAAIGILGAIIERKNTADHLGQYIDIAMLDSAFAFNPVCLASTLTTNLKSLSNFNGETPNYTHYKTKDAKYIAVGSLEPKFWYKLCDTLEIPKFKDKLSEIDKNMEAIYDVLSQIFLQKTQSEWKDIFKSVKACVTPVHSNFDVMHDEQLLHRNMIIEQDHPVFGKILNIGTPIKYSRTPLSIRKPAPLKGEDSDAILMKKTTN